MLCNANFSHKQSNGGRAHQIVAAAAQQLKKIAAHSARRLNLITRAGPGLQLRAIKPSPRKQY
jgi:hypothetical protein